MCVSKSPRLMCSSFNLLHTNLSLDLRLQHPPYPAVQRSFNKRSTPLSYPNFFSYQSFALKFRDVHTPNKVPLIIYTNISPFLYPWPASPLRLTTFIPTFLFDTNISPSHESMTHPHTNVTSSYQNPSFIPTSLHDLTLMSRITPIETLIFVHVSTSYQRQFIIPNFSVRASTMLSSAYPLEWPSLLTKFFFFLPIPPRDTLES